MTKYTTFSTALHTKLAALFPSKFKIPTPENLEQNDDNQLKDSWGVIFGSSNMDDDQFCADRFNHSFTVVLSKIIYRNTSDIAIWIAAKESMKEDQIKILQLLQSSNMLDTPQTYHIINIESGSAIEQVYTDSYSIIKCEVEFIVNITEDRT